MKLKSYVRNRACPEGCIAEGYLAQETLTFASRYLNDDVETWLNRPLRNTERHTIEAEVGWEIFSDVTRPVGVGVGVNIHREELCQAHRYVLFNCDAITPYIK